MILALMNLVENLRKTDERNQSERNKTDKGMNIPEVNKVRDFKSVATIFQQELFNC